MIEIWLLERHAHLSSARRAQVNRTTRLTWDDLSASSHRMLSFALDVSCNARGGIDAGFLSGSERRA